MNKKTFFKAAIADALIIVIGGAIGKIAGSFVVGMIIATATLILSDISSAVIMNSSGLKISKTSAEVYSDEDPETDGE